MAYEFKLPSLGENIDEAEVVRVIVAVGDQVAVDDPVIEIESDKASLEVPVPRAGKVASILVAEGDTVHEGTTVLTLEGTAEAPAEPTPAREAEPEPEPTPAPEPEPEPEPAPEAPAAGGDKLFEFRLPSLGENIDTADVVTVLVSPGDVVEQDQAVMEIESDKATVEIPAPVAGKIAELHVEKGIQVGEGDLVMTILTGAAPKPKPAPKPKAATAAVESAPPPSPPARQPAQPVGPAVAAAPGTRRFARFIGVDIHSVPGSGAGGRVSVDDVMAHSRTSRAAGAPVEDLPDFSTWGPVETEKLSQIRTKTATHLTHAWAAPHVTHFDQADITDLEAARKRLKEVAAERGGNLTVTAILVKVIAGALKQFPRFNAAIDLANKQLVYRKYYHVGVAVDTDRGLVVPVIRDVDGKSIMDLAVELNQIAAKARDRKLTIEEMQGGCMTITNLGGIGGRAFTPILNWPEVAILGVARGGYEPVWQDGQWVPRLMLPLCLSYDHRVIDGADAARFSRWLAEALQNPYLLALGDDVL